MRDILTRTRGLTHKVESHVSHLLSDPPGGYRPTVLLVEDDRTTRLAMKGWLARNGFSVLEAASCQDAARCLDRPPRPIDLAVFDVGLPDVNGAELCEVVREFHPSLPVVVCSGLATSEDVERVQGAGVHQVLTKPVGPEEFVAAVESALR
jgi:DNA-binding response OmpR family regulator